MKDKLYKLMNWPEIEAIVYGEEGCPQEILGRHNISSYTLFQTFIPDAKQVVLVTEEDDKEYTMELADEEGFYAIAVLGKIKGSYYYLVTDLHGKKRKVYDPYDYSVAIKKEDIASWNKGTMLNAGELLGSSVKTLQKTKGVLFRVWAPNAVRVSVIGDFNSWNGKTHPMMKDEETGIFSLFIPGLASGEEYKYELSIKGGTVYSKNDPYAPGNDKGNSIVEAHKSFKWEDGVYLEKNSINDRSKLPAGIYETELAGLFNEKFELNKNALDKLIASVKNLSANYVQFISEVDDAYGLMDGVNVDDMRSVVAALHKEEIGVIYNWNPCAFSMREGGLGVFDGTYLYGHMDERKRCNPALNAFNYNYGRPQVRNYLMSAAVYLMKEFHFDGLHIDALSSILYLDYGKYEGEWASNIYGGHENLDAIQFIKDFNSLIHKEFPYAITTTKEVCAFPKVTEDIKNDGLGFDLIWNNGFSEDYLNFIKGDRAFKNISLLTNGMSYEYAENYILTMSKDDVIAANDYDALRVDKGAGYFDYIPVDDKGKPAVKRATLAYMTARPGKKLIYAGQEDVKESLALGKLYKDLTAFHRLDRNPYGFEWISAIDHGDGVVAFMRKDEYLNHSILVVCNFSQNTYASYKFGMPYEGKYKEIFCSEDKKYGGKVTTAAKEKITEEEFYDGRANSLTVKIPAMSVSYYAYTPYTEEELLEIAEAKVARFKEKLEKEAKEKAKALAKKSSK